MRKEAGRIVLILLAILFLATNVLAGSQSSNLKLDDKNYNIKMPFLDNSKVMIEVNEERNYVDNIQSAQPYYTTKIKGLDLILKDTNYGGYVGGPFDARVWVGARVNLSIAEEKNLTIDGVTYSIYLNFIDNDKVQFGVYNDDCSGTSMKLISQSTQPYYLHNYIGAENICGLDIAVISRVYQGFVGGVMEAVLLAGKDINLSLYESCSDECIDNERICEDDGYKICGDYDTDECLEWSEVNDCDSGETCSNGVCVAVPIPTPTCSNECNVSGEKGCFNISYYRVCGNYDEDSCLEWSDVILCPMGPTGRICSQGECAGFPEPVKECEQIGVRQSGKYCSTEYKLINQKMNSISCENNFECKSNNCLDGVCGGKKYPKYVTYLIIAGVIIIIIGIVLVIRKAMR